MQNHIEAIKATVVTGRHKEIETLVKKAIEDKVPPETIISDAMIEGMNMVGRQFSEHEIFVPEMLVSSVTMKKGLDLLEPLLKSGGAQPRGTVIMCTVKGDVHDIGKNLVVMMLEGAGFEVINLGVDQGMEELIEKVKEHKPDILGLSALLTTAMPEMQRVIESLEASGLRGQVKVMVGGAPVSAAFARKIGADGYGRDAGEAVQVAKSFM